MRPQQIDKDRVKAQKIGIHGDEILILFFSLIFLIFLVLSSFRLFAIGKLFDDFIFIFLFGWSKYLVYLFLYAIVLPIFFNYFLEIRFSFFVGMFWTFISFSWVIENFTILGNTASNDIWWELNFYDFEDDFLLYLDVWWESTIINNYDGFFSQPISFEDWTDFNSFFPDFAAGGIVANFLIFLSGLGGFFTSFVASLLLLTFCLSWLFFSRPFLLFIFIFIFMLPLVRYFKRQNDAKLREKEIREESKKYLNKRRWS